MDATKYNFCDIFASVLDRIKYKRLWPRYIADMQELWIKPDACVERIDY